jgi:hypothetical protein
MLHIRLNPGLPGGRWARLRPLCGHDEALVDRTGHVDVIAFLDRLLAHEPGTTVGPGRAADLAVCDCDRLCASIYLDCFGERVDARATCGDCREPFDLSFSLRDLIEDLDRRRPSEAVGPDDEGVFTSADGRRFRLPTAGEQRLVKGLDTDAAVAALLRQCVVEGEPTIDPQTIEATMDQVGALLDLDLDAVCPHCDLRQTVRFDIQSYLFRALGHERQFLNYEVHSIAMAYGWGYEEILSLHREDRRTYVRLIQSDRGARRRASGE